MAKQEAPPEVEKTPAPASPIDVQQGAELEKSLLRRRKGKTDAYLTKGQKKPSMLSKGQLGSNGNQL